MGSVARPSGCCVQLVLQSVLISAFWWHNTPTIPLSAQLTRHNLVLGAPVFHRKWLLRHHRELTHRHGSMWVTFFIHWSMNRSTEKYNLLYCNLISFFFFFLQNDSQPPCRGLINVPWEIIRWAVHKYSDLFPASNVALLVCATVAGITTKYSSTRWQQTVTKLTKERASELHVRLQFLRVHPCCVLLNSPSKLWVNWL